MTPTTEQKRATFHALHRQGCFVLPNPWDAGSARMLQGLGFKALASTSSGHAWSLGQPDGAISREMTLEHLRSLVAATDLPVNADESRALPLCFAAHDLKSCLIKLR